MIKLVVLTGAQGSGQTTISQEIEKLKFIKRLKPYTTRPKRFNNEDEYMFLDSPPDSAAVMWSIQRSGYEYGMLKAQIQGLESSDVAVTVFDPLHLDKLHSLRERIPDIEIITIGLDTIETVQEQSSRVNGDSSRLSTQAELDRIRSIIEKTDVKISGETHTVTLAVKAICEIIMSRGGILTRQQFVPLINASTLLRDVLLDNVQTASYDLRVGSEIWCGGFKTLTEDSPLFEIPPYSYAIVKSIEVAIIPPFITAQFDIRVSHFLSGLILSNGPQVDPGYKGDLFCMLFNGNSSPRVIRRGDHFATIQFLTTTRGGVPYDGYYRMRSRLASTIPADVAAGPGGKIIETIRSEVADAIADIKKEMPKDNTNVSIAVHTLMVAIILGVVAFASSSITDVNKSHMELKSAMLEFSKLQSEMKSLNSDLIRAKDDIERIKSSITSLRERSASPNQIAPK